jgi:hypothetical protein
MRERMTTQPATHYFDLIRSLEYPSFPGTIFPSEMAFFLYSCDRAGVAAIIESGRQDGYSTAVLGSYGDIQGVPVSSIDIEADPPRAQVTRERLARFKSLEVSRGNSYRVIPRVLRNLPGPVALLIDGPKEHDAIYLSAAAAAYGPVSLVAHHNTEPGTPWHPHFIARFGEAGFFEQSDLASDPDAPGFRQWEREFTRDTNRDLAQTSLAIARLPTEGPRLRHLRGPTAWHTLNAWSLYLSWRVGFAFMPAMLYRRLLWQ